MSPEEQLCRRVLFLSSVQGVPPVVSAQLGQAVARYHQATEPTFARIVATIALGLLGVIFALGGLAGMRFVERTRPADPETVAWFALAAVATALGVGLCYVAGDRLRRWRP